MPRTAKEESSSRFATAIDHQVSLPPSQHIADSLGAHHDLSTGLDELLDNSLDAGARTIAVVFHVESLENMRLSQVSIHDDGKGMSADTLTQALRLGGHASHGNGLSIGMFGVGMKEGSLSNAKVVTILSRVKGAPLAGVQLNADDIFTANVLEEASAYKLWNTRNTVAPAAHGTTILWDGLRNVYHGDDDVEARTFLSTELEKIRRHCAIRYHRYLHEGGVTLNFYTQLEDSLPSLSAAAAPINPFGYRRNSRSVYPVELTVDGVPGNPGITAHIFPPGSKKDEYTLEGGSALGHQGFFFYLANRLITQGGWSDYRTDDKQLKLLRFEVTDPRVVEEFLTVSSRKGSVRLNENFHRFMDSLRSPADPSVDIDRVLDDARARLKDANKRSANPDPLAEAGDGIARSIKAIVEEEAPLKSAAPVNVEWTSFGSSEDFLRLDRDAHTVWLNTRYRKLFNPGKGRKNDAPVIKTLLYLLFNDALSSARWGGKLESNTELWSTILSQAVKEMEEQEAAFNPR